MSVTVLVLSTMQTFVLELFGSPEGAQFPATLQFPLAPSDQTDGVPLSVQVSANAGAAEKASIPKASATGDAAARCL